MYRHASSLCLAGLALTGVYSLVTIPLTPSLLGTHPVLLEALRGSTTAMVAAGAFARVGRGSLELALVAPLLTLMIGDPLLWWAGRLWGPDIAHTLARGGPRAVRRTERAIGIAARYGSWAVPLAYFLPVPNGLIYACAGWTGMSLWRFLALDLCGTLLWVLANVGVGYGMGGSAVTVAKEISHYGLILTLALFVALPLLALRRRRQALLEG